MNTFSNYSELEELVVDWLDRQDIKDKVNTFVRLITAELSKALRVPTMERKVLLDVYGDGSAKVPHNLIELIGVNWVAIKDGEITSRKALNRGSINRYNKTRTGDFYIGDPDSFTRIENSFKLYPLPPMADKFVDKQAYNDTVVGYAEIYYYALPYTINEPNERNWILDVSPDIYFYGCLMHANRYIRDMDAAEYWQSKYERSIKELQASADIAEWSGGPIVVGESNG